MLMFYKEDGSYDIEAFYKQRLIDEYQEGYGVGEDIGQANGIKIGKKQGISIGETRGRKLDQRLERTNIITNLSNRGLSNDEIANVTSISIEEVEKILDPDSLKLKRKVH